jgi:hypothetical protein
MSGRHVTENIRARLVGVRKRGKVLARALRTHAEIAVVRRRLRTTFSELGERIYGEMAAGRATGWGDAAGLPELRTRIERLKVDISHRKEKLVQIVKEAEKETGRADPEMPAAESE